MSIGSSTMGPSAAIGPGFSTARGGDWIDPGSALATQRFYRVTADPAP